MQANTSSPLHPKDTPPTWPHPACQDEQTLLAQCDSAKNRASGPGGQHRNKVETAVELTHRPTGIEAHATERRSVTENRRVAITRLRLNLAVGVRTPVPIGDVGSSLWRSRVRGAVRQTAPKSPDPVLRSLGVTLRSDAPAPSGRIVVSPDHHDYPALLAEALDVIAAAGWDLRPAGARLGVSMSQLLKLLKDHPPALVMLNKQRAVFGLKPLK